MKATITTAQAVSHPDVAQTITVLGELVDKYRDETEGFKAINAELLEALLLIDPSGKFVGWQDGNGIDIGRQINAAIAKATQGEER